jgi:tRNA threonylcarbamoyl adenosine modification protein YeaZ
MFRFLIDTTNSYLALSATRDETVIFTIINKFVNRTNETILLSIDECLKNNKLSLDHFDEFYVIIGPGSYTGIRIGIATMLAFSIAFGKPLIGISLLDAFALSQDKSTVRIFYCIRNNYYVTKYYNFERDVYSEYEIVESPGLCSYENPDLCSYENIVIKDNYYNAANTLLNKKLGFFKRDYKPVYFSNNFYDKMKI